MAHTYDRDFEYLEVVEQDLNLLSDNELNSANDSLEADPAALEEEKNKKNTKSVASPQHMAAKAPPSRSKQSTSVGVI